MNLPKLLKQAEKLTSNGKLNEAIEIYQEILSDDFQNLAVHNLIAQLYVEKGDMQRASRHLFKIAAESSSQGNVSDATGAYRQIIKILPKNTLAREKLLEVFTRTNSKGELISMITELCSISEAEGNSQKTIEYLEKLVALDAGNRAHATKLALFLNERGLKDKAIEVLYQLARELYGEDRFDEALATLEKVRAIDSKHKLLGARMAEVYEKQGKIERAIDSLSSSIADGSQSALQHLAGLYIKAGRVEEAERVYEKLLKSDRSFLPEIVPFIEVLLAERKIDRAIFYIDRLHKEVEEPVTRRKCVELLEEILKLDPQKLDAYRLLEAFYGASFQYDQLAITLLSHADTYITKCEYAKALDIARQLLDLEPYNEEYRKKYELIEKLSSGGAAQKASGKAVVVQADDDDDSPYVAARVDAHFDSTVSIVTDEDVENFIVDIELLEKFGQHTSAIGRLEHVVKQYPQEIKLRQKLKSLYFDRKMPKRAAKECLEIAKVLQQQGQKEEAGRYLREAQRLNPLLSSAKREGVDTSAPQKTESRSLQSNDHVALRGDLSEIGLLDVIQILENCQKNGKLLLNSEGHTGTILFNAGRMVDATFLDKAGEQAVYALVAVKGGSFDYEPSNTPYNVVINNTNTNLLLEGLRLLDEANRDQGDPENVPSTLEVAPPPPPKDVPTESVPPTPVPAVPAMAAMSAPSFIEEEFPLEEI